MTTIDPSHLVEIHYHCIRKISSPEDEEHDRTIYAGQMPLRSILELPTHENVREFLLDAEGLKRRKPTQVHRAIRDTLDHRPEMFSVLNGGIVIVARISEIDEKTKTLKLLGPSIINGSQTQGVVKKFFEENPQDSLSTHVKFELIITSDDGLIAEISIARNYQDDVKPISIIGTRGQLNELNERISRQYPGKRLRRSETQRPSETNDIVDTERLLKVIAALLPSTLQWKPGGEFSKTYTYDRPTTCLKDFALIQKRATDSSDPQHELGKKVYEFYLDIAPKAMDIAAKWKQHQGFKGTGLHSLKRASDGKIVDVPDGILFPIFASFSVFAVKDPDGWDIAIPSQLTDDELIQAAKSCYIEIARSKPEIMGKTKACYTHMQQITSIYKKLLPKNS